MTSLTYNNFKSTTVRGVFHNTTDVSNSIISDAIFDNNIHCNGNIYMNNIDLSSTLLTFAKLTDLSSFITTNSLSTSNLIIHSLNINGYDLDSRLKQLTYTIDYGVKWSSTYPTSSIGDGKKGYECYWNDIHPGYGQTDILNYSQAGSNGGFTFNTLKTDNSGNIPIQLVSFCVDNSTFSNKIICPSITLNGSDLQTTLSNYLTTNSLSNSNLIINSLNINGYDLDSRLSQLTYSDGYGIKLYNLYPVNSLLKQGLFGYECYWNHINYGLGQTDILNYSVNSTNGGFTFNTMSTYGTNNTPVNLVSFTVNNSTFNNRIICPSITLNGVDLATTLSTFLTSTPSLTGYANLTASLNTFTGNVIFNNGNVAIGTVNSPANQYLDVYSTTTFTKFVTFQNGLTTDSIIYNGTELTTTLSNYPSLSASINVFSGGCSFNTLATFFGGINTDTITFNGVNLNTRLNTYVLTSALSTTLSSYALTTALSNYVLSSSLNTLLQNLTHSPGFGFNASTFPTTSAGDYKYGYDAFWNQSNGIGETDLLSYGQGGVGGFRFYSLNTSLTSSTPQQLLSIDITNGTIIKTNLTINGIQNSCRKSITYLTSSFTLTEVNLTSYYLVTNNASITFNCFTPIQYVTDGYELNIRNGGTGIVTITGCCPYGSNINTTSFNILQYQSCKMFAGSGLWYQI